MRLAVAALVVALAGCDWILQLKDVPTAPDHSWLSVVAGDHATCGIDRGNELWCWGDNSTLQTGTSSSAAELDAPTQVPGSWIAVAIGTSSACGIQADHSLWCWGSKLGGSGSPNGSPVQVTTGATSYQAVSLFAVTACALSDDSKVWCFGSNSDGQADPTQTDTSLPAPTLIDIADPIAHVSTGAQHTCALAQRGALYCWGTNFAGQASGTDGDPHVVVTQIAGTFKAVSAGDNFTCAITTDDTVQCWGINRTANLGRGDTSYSETAPAAIATIEKYSAISAGWDGACALVAGRLECWGDNTGTGIVGTPTEIASPTHLAWVTVSVGRTHWCAIDQVGKLYCTGDGSSGQLANGSSALATPHVVIDANVHSVAIGDTSACAEMTDHTMQCWGGNENGQLALGMTARMLAPTPAMSPAIETISINNDHACALDTTKHAWCWGNNPTGALGNGSYSGSSVPVQASTLQFDSIAVGNEFVLAISGKALYGWGQNNSGQLYIAPTPPALPANVPTRLDSSYPYTGVSAGYEFGCAVSTDHFVRCLGKNDQNQRGDAMGGFPDQITNPDGAQYNGVVSGREFSCALWGVTAYCFGRDQEGQLGSGNIMSIASPTRVTIGNNVDILQLALGRRHACALDGNHHVSCWGDGRHGQLGRAPTTIDGVPTQIDNLDNVDFVAAGGDTSCAVKQGQLLCWGDNGLGQLGIATNWSSELSEITLPDSTL